MGFFDYLQFAFFLLLLTTLTPPLGSYMAKVFQGQKTFMSRPLGWLERLIYKGSGVEASIEMNWKQYSVALISFNLLGIFAVFLFQMFQGFLPLNPQGMGAPTWHSAINTAVSFVTNTNWQGYAGETTMSYFTQMIALSVQNFVSAAVGLAVAVALIRGVTRRESKTIGNYWVDLTRATVYILLPLATIYTLFLVSQGVVQTFASYLEIQTLEGAKQLIPLGPAASQIAIKMLGTNGGGFFNANAAHPFENPTAISNFFQMLAIFLIPAALTFTYGSMARNQKHGWIIFGAMMLLFVTLTSASLASEYTTNPVMRHAGVMEGKEVRLGVFNSVFFSSVTTAASCGAVNTMHSSLSPLSGGIAMLNMMLGEVIFGGVGAGFYGMMLFILMTVFIAGLMVGRTPEYFGKKIEANEMKMVIFAILAPCAVILIGTAISVVSPMALSSLAHKGPHGFSEVLYAFTSAAANNGSAFGGLNANTTYFNIALSIAMLVGRFAIILPLLAVAGSLARKKVSPVSSGTFETDNFLFLFLLVAVILIVGALTFVPALSLGPIVEHFMMLKGQSF